MILPTWGPDGKRVAYVSSATAFPDTVSTALGEATEAFDIWIMYADGQGKARLTDGHTSNFAPVFSPDGKIFFTSNRSGHENIWSLQPGELPVGASPERSVTNRTTLESPVNVKTASTGNNL